MENPSDTTRQLPPHPSVPRRLVRRPDQGPLGGVCAGVAEYFNVDPTMVRIAAVVLAFMGPGVPGYLIAWAFVPKGDGASIAASVGPGAGQRDRGTQILGVVLMVVAVSILWGDWWIPGKGWLVPLGLIGLGAWLLLRNDDEPGAAPVPPGPTRAAATTSAPWTDTAYGATATAHDTTDDDAAVDSGAAVDGDALDPTDPAAPADQDTLVDGQPTTDATGAGGPPAVPPSHLGDTTGPIEPAPAAASPRRRVLGPIVFGVLFIWGGIAWLAGVEVDTGLAVALCIMGLGFVLGAFIGGSWALLPPTLLIAVALVLTSIVDIPFRGGVGDKAWSPVTVSQLEDEYELGIGEGTLDLRDLVVPAGEEVDIDVHQGVGHLLVYLPADTDVDITAEVGMGKADVVGRHDDGLGIEIDRQVTGTGDRGSIDLDLDLGVGHIEVIEVDANGDAEVDLPAEPTVPSLPR